MLLIFSGPSSNGRYYGDYFVVFGIFLLLWLNLKHDLCDFGNFKLLSCHLFYDSSHTHDLYPKFATITWHPVRFVSLINYFNGFFISIYYNRWSPYKVCNFAKFFSKIYYVSPCEVWNFAKKLLNCILTKNVGGQVFLCPCLCC